MYEEIMTNNDNLESNLLTSSLLCRRYTTHCIRLQFPVTAKICPKLRGVFLFHYPVLKCNLQQIKLLTIEDSTLAPINKQLLSDLVSYSEMRLFAH